MASGDPNGPGGDLATRLAALLGAEAVRGLRRLSGGASGETWSFEAQMPGGTVRPLVLRRPRPGTVVPEAAVMAAAAAAGVPVPPVVAASDGPSPLGGPFVVTAHVEGETIPRRILRDDAYAGARERLVDQCARALAAIHRMTPVPGLPEGDELARLDAAVGAFAAAGWPSAVFATALRWLATTRPAPTGRVVVHGDFRLGNLIVGPDGLRAVLDWELAHIGDPAEDLGWLCVRAWRFGNDDRRVAGVGDVDALLRAYRDAAGRTVDPATLRWWETFGTLKWGVACMVQAQAHLLGTARSVELAAVGRRVCENEWDLLVLLAEEGVLPPPPTPPALAPGAAEEVAGLHGRPTAAELAEAVEEFLRRDALEGLEGRARFHARVAANVCAILQRELRHGPALAAAATAALARAGVATEAELAEGIRAGTLDWRRPAVAAALHALVAARLAVANPGHAVAGRRAD
jgi:aminoglycoside phosphotransferase (APT) family kinase protein